MAEQSIIQRVQKLLERAGHPETPEAEARLCEEKAEQLMAQHRIDQMDLTPEEKSRITKSHWDIHVGDSGSDATEFYSAIFTMLQSVLTHCGVRVHPRVSYAKREDGRTDWNVRRIQLVGFPEDITYAENIWFTVFKTFVLNVNPRWDTTIGFDENVYNMIRAGYNMRQTQDMAYAARDDHYGLPKREHKSHPMIGKALKREVERRGEEWHVNKKSQSTWRSSFARSYTSTIGMRLRELRAKAEETVSDAEKFALAVRDTKERVDEEFYRLFPEFDPEVKRRMREAEEFEAACAWAALSEAEQAKVLRDQAREDARWARRASRARANYGRVRESEQTNMVAWSRGKKVADSVNLRVDGEVKNKKRGELK